MLLANVNHNANKIIVLSIHNVIVYVHKIIAIIMMKDNVGLIVAAVLLIKFMNLHNMVRNVNTAVMVNMN